MFTGIVERQGSVVRVEPLDRGARLFVEAGDLARHVVVGESIAVNGVCLTVVRAEPPTLCFEAIQETLARSNLGELQAGSRVNLERALAADGRLSGHFVQGHVDGVGEVASVTPEGEALRIRIRVRPELFRYIVEKGSIAVDGVSLTVTGCDKEFFEAAIIPHTRSVTTLGRKASGESVNLEVDVLAKYVEKLLEGRGTQ